MNKGLVFGGLAAFTLFVYLKGRKDERDKPDETERDAENDVIVSDLTYNESWYSQAADAIEVNLNKSWDLNPVTTNDEHAAFRQVLVYILKLKNKSDWLKLVSKFGTRKRIKLSGAKGTLNEWLLSMTNVEIKGGHTTYLDMIRKLLSKRGVQL